MFFYFVERVPERLRGTGFIVLVLYIFHETCVDPVFGQDLGTLGGQFGTDCLKQFKYVVNAHL
jgi:hypothetical protein